MRFNNVFRKFIAWMASAAILASAFAPTLTHALQQAAPGSGWTEVCTALGSEWVRADDGGGGATGSRSGAPKHTPQQHCPFCASHDAGLALPPSPPAPFLFVPAARLGPPGLSADAPRTPAAFTTAQPRAPPRRA